VESHTRISCSLGRPFSTVDSNMALFLLQDN
jgi:hypothetical protein